MRSFREIVIFAAVCLSPLTTQAAPISYTAILTGAAESPPNASPATGIGQVSIDTDANALWVRFSFAGLQAPLTVAHIHGPTAAPGSGNAGVLTPTPTFPGTPAGSQSGNYDQVFDLTMASTYSGSFLTNVGSVAAAETALAAYLAAGTAYLNVHSQLYPGGEIRGFLQPVAPVPLPQSLPLAIGGILVLGGLRCARRR